jgi:hypothetical protein
VSFLVEMPVERQADGARRVGWNDRQGAYGGDGLAQIICIVDGIGDDHLGLLPIDQRWGLRRIAGLTCSQHDPGRATQAAYRKVQLAAQAATGTVRGLSLSPSLPPAACWCAGTMVLSTIRWSNPASSAMAAKIRCQTPLAL